MSETTEITRVGAAASLAELNAELAAAQPVISCSTRPVFGEGPLAAAIAFVGEQPGDSEDVEGRPFVGPAGQMLDLALSEAGIERTACYVTNAVKHFKFIERGKRRLHQKPTSSEIKHYRLWLLREIEIVKPRLVVALGATAVQSLAGKPISILRFRGETRFSDWRGYITIHPSYILRLRHEMERKQAYQAFVGDLRSIKKLAAV